MTETAITEAMPQPGETALTSEDLMAQAVVLIDDKLSQLPARNIVSANEVSDLLLDIRVLLSEARDTEARSSLPTEVSQLSLKLLRRGG